MLNLFKIFIDFIILVFSFFLPEAEDFCQGLSNFKKITSYAYCFMLFMFFSLKVLLMILGVFFLPEGEDFCQGLSSFKKITSYAECFLSFSNFFLS